MNLAVIPKYPAPLSPSGRVCFGPLGLSRAAAVALLNAGALLFITLKILIEHDRPNHTAPFLIITHIEYGPASHTRNI